MERTLTDFTKLNCGWNAEPGAPYPEVRVEGNTLILSFYLNPWRFPEFKLGDVGELTFSECWRYRLGPPDEDQWHRGLCRFVRRVPNWGEFYEVAGDLRLERLPADAWTSVADQAKPDTRHFLFYFKDETFECDAKEFGFEVLRAAEGTSAGWKKISLPSGSSVVLIPPRSGPQMTKDHSGPTASADSLVARAFHFFRRLRNHLL